LRSAVFVVVVLDEKIEWLAFIFLTPLPYFALSVRWLL
jgi:hypothetical protein